ncbi:MAG: PBSX family phage terminase large subunit [Spirochaetales bacterium]|nr:PBSX family phage terminase large subunit [Spirochaetales bacterium]
MAPKLKKINSKALESITNCGFLTVWEGAVRSGKTVPSLWAWLSYIISSQETVFLMSGFSLGSLIRNCVSGDFGLVALSAGQGEVKRDESGWFFGIFSKKVYLTGAGNKAAYKTVTGITAGGWYADEINLHHKSAVVEFFNRTLASTDRRNFWTLNPEPPGHWIYKDFLDRYDKEKPAGYRWFHFTLDDNPAITEERKQEVRGQYSGVFYRRFILGLRVRAEGVCYPSYDPSVCEVDELPGKILYVNVGSDIGGTKSATAYAGVAFFKHQKTNKLCIGIIAEHYDQENKDTESIVAAYGRFVNSLRWEDSEKKIKKYTVPDGYSDSAEQLILKSFRNLGVVAVHNSKKKPIRDRIRFADSLMAQGRFFVLKKCRHTIEAIQGAVWDHNSSKEERLDDGTSNIDSLDALEYGFEPRMKDFV